jgi:HPt (histidine-containing phosphotransfer) domain-containing protein
MDPNGSEAGGYPDVVERLREIGLLDDPLLLAETVELFIADAALMVTKISDAFAEGDLDALERAAHRLKGAALNFGANAIAQAARTLEEEARRGGFVGAPSAIHALENELAHVAPFLRAQVQAVRSGS